jgi:hypothetical protein
MNASSIVLSPHQDLVFIGCILLAKQLIMSIFVRHLRQSQLRCLALLYLYCFDPALTLHM